MSSELLLCSKLLLSKEGGVRRLSASIAELRALGDCEDGYKSVRLLERLRLENMEKGIHLRLMMKEMQLKIAKKKNFMLKLRGCGGLGFCGGIDLSLGATHKFVYVGRILCMVVIVLCMLFLCELRSYVADSCSLCSSGLRAISEDLRLAHAINGLCTGLTADIEERYHFIDELDFLVDRLVSKKTVEFLKKTQGKGTEKLMKMQILGREFELRDHDKNLFIKKLKGTWISECGDLMC
nr:hypothetical protein [Tanacetum cinerariifolium]